MTNKIVKDFSTFLSLVFTLLVENSFLGRPITIPEASPWQDSSVGIGTDNSTSSHSEYFSKNRDIVLLHYLHLRNRLHEKILIFSKSSDLRFSAQPSDFNFDNAYESNCCNTCDDLAFITQFVLWRKINRSRRVTAVAQSVRK